MQNLTKDKQTLLAEKRQIQLSLLEQQSFDRVEGLLERFELPLEPGPRLEIVLREERQDPLPFEPAEPEDEADSWRGWLARMNQAQAMMTSSQQRSFGWRAPLVGQAGRTSPQSEKDQE